ncbi:glutaminyl-peptide cyclotransferase [Actinophytocola sp.]|uniref:glutaminyl-peptide cyclotransferase n=1 Tax=Actinophytocola sp. TaxID=1872138 RepID=UPI0039C86DB7
MRALLAAVAALLVAACAPADPSPPTPSAPTSLKADVLETLPHDPKAFTQGLEIDDGVLYEGTGLEGESSMRATDPDTGQVEKSTRLPADMFGEGITVVGDTIWQLTWQDGVAIKRDRRTLAERGRASYAGEGWGLCHDGKRLIMSDGTDRLTFRDPATFDETGHTDVTDADGRPIDQLNELECVDGDVYANVWRTDRIVRIDPETGKVTATVDLTGLLPAEDRAGTDVLNGIASIPGTDEFLVTGKLWPAMFRVRFVTDGD